MGCHGYTIKEVKNKRKEYEKELSNEENIYLVKEYKDAKKRNMKLKMLKYIKGIYPYLLAFGFVSVFVATLSKQELKKYGIIKETFDTFGNDSSITDYSGKYRYSNSELKHISKWELNENSEYERTIKSYDIEKYNSEVIRNIISNENTMYTLDDIFGKPISTEKEVSKNITEEEINLPEHIDVIRYTKDNEKYIVENMTISKKVIWGGTDLGLTLLISLLIVMGREYDLRKELLGVEKRYFDELEGISERAKTLKLEN